VNKLIAIAFTSLALIAFQKKHIDWKTFMPLVTTRNQVEATLGAPTSGKDNFFVHETTDERVSVWYGGGKVLGRDVCCLKVPNEILFKFVLVPKRTVLLTEMNIDLAAFRKEKALEMVNDYYYYNENEGTTITTRIVDGKEVLLSIERGPSSAQRQEYCRKTDC
jgi:hypothetical protein